MIVKDIRIQAQLHISLNIEPQYAIRYLNEGINQIANRYDTGCTLKTAEIEVKECEFTDIPGDYKKLVEIYKSGQIYREITILNGKIKCNHSGTIKMEYLAYPELVTNENDIPGIPSPYHYSLALFIGSREKSRLYGDEDGDSVRLMQEFYMNLETANTSLKNNGKKRKIKARRWW